MRDTSFRDFVLDQLRDLPSLECRPMFGGHGLYSGETFFGIIDDGRLYFKVGASTIADYTSRGSGPFRPTPKQTLRSYYEVPAEILEDRERLTAWASDALRQAKPVRRSAGSKRGR
jgi:DNA transformation protein and related proteins